MLLFRKDLFKYHFIQRPACVCLPIPNNYNYYNYNKTTLSTSATFPTWSKDLCASSKHLQFSLFHFVLLLLVFLLFDFAIKAWNDVYMLLSLAVV